MFLIWCCFKFGVFTLCSSINSQVRLYARESIEILHTTYGDRIWSQPIRLLWLAKARHEQAKTAPQSLWANGQIRSYGYTAKPAAFRMISLACLSSLISLSSSAMRVAWLWVVTITGFCWSRCFLCHERRVSGVQPLRSMLLRRYGLDGRPQWGIIFLWFNQ